MNARDDLLEDPLLPVTLMFAAVLLAWDTTGGDLALARLAGGPTGFPWRDHWLLSGLLHEAARRVAWVFALLLCLGVWWPVGPLRKLAAGRRLQLAATTVAAALAVQVLKAYSPTSCPWDLSDFGGVARYLPHWRLQADGGGGHCFPAGHASCGFAFLGGYFAWRPSDAALARAWLGAAVVAGLAFGLVQQWRGAHFMSHTLWTGWMCWVVAWAMDRMHWERAAWPA